MTTLSEARKTGLNNATPSQEIGEGGAFVCVLGATVWKRFGRKVRYPAHGHCHEQQVRRIDCVVRRIDGRN